MSENMRLYDMTALAEASYVYFDALNNNYSDQKVYEALQQPDLEGKFSATQADDFVQNWQVISHQPNTSSGFSATLFKSNSQVGSGLHGLLPKPVVSYKTFSDLEPRASSSLINYAVTSASAGCTLRHRFKL